MQVIIDFLMQFVLWLYAIVVALFVTLSNVLYDFVCWIFEEVLTLVLYIIGTISVDIFPTDLMRSTFLSLPPEVLNVIFYLHLPYCVGLVLSSLFVRLMLQLVPFTRLGS